MKIAIAHYSVASDISGVTSWLIGFCHRLAADGHQLGVHLHHYGDNPEDASILPELRRMQVEVFPVPRTGSLEHDTRLTLGFLNQFRPELFLPQCLHAHHCAAVQASRQGLPWVLTMHSDDPDYWCVADALNPDRNGGHAVCVSGHLAEVARSRQLLRAPRVIPYGTRIPTTHTRFHTEPFRVVYIGRMVSQQKCILQVVRTLIAACGQCPVLQADLVGDGAERPACERMVARAGLTGRIRFVGRMPPAEVPTLLQQAQAIVLMSDFEGLPVALLEAMAAGVVPVVRSIPSGIPELVQHERTGLLVPNDPAAAAAALARLAGDRKLWETCSIQARQLAAAKFSAEHCYTLWNELIAECQRGQGVSYPIPDQDLSSALPLQDPRFRSQYPPPRSPWNSLHPRRIARRLRRLLRGY